MTITLYPPSPQKFEELFRKRERKHHLSLSLRRRHFHRLHGTVLILLPLAGFRNCDNSTQLVARQRRRTRCCRVNRLGGLVFDGFRLRCVWHKDLLLVCFLFLVLGFQYAHWASPRISVLSAHHSSHWALVATCQLGMVAAALGPVRERGSHLRRLLGYTAI